MPNVTHFMGMDIEELLETMGTQTQPKTIELSEINLQRVVALATTKIEPDASTNDMVAVIAREVFDYLVEIGAMEETE